MILRHRKENILLIREMGIFGIDKDFILNKNVDLIINFRLKYYVSVYSKGAKYFKLRRYSISDEDYELLRLS